MVHRRGSLSPERVRRGSLTLTIVKVSLPAAFREFVDKYSPHIFILHPMDIQKLAKFEKIVEE